MTALPKRYAWLDKEGAPKMLVEALKLYGTVETPGAADNPTIIKWAKEIGVNWYRHDSTPWCGLYISVVAKRAGKDVPVDSLRAMAWQKFGTAAKIAMLGDVLVFTRKGGGHVGLYVGEDQLYYHVLGGNQSDAVSIKRVPRSRCIAVRRPPYLIGKPANVRRIILAPNGAISTSET